MKPHKLDSLVYSMMLKALDKGVTLNIRVPEAFLGRRNDEVKGEILTVDYWSVEKIINIQYGFWGEDRTYHRRDYRVRILTAKMFDDSFTLKKIDGILTLVPIEREEEPIEEARGAKDTIQKGEELTMAGELALRTMRSWLNHGRTVLMHKVVGVTSAHGPLRSIEPNSGVWLFRMDGEEGWTSQAHLLPTHINRLNLKVEKRAGFDTLVVTSKKDDDEAA